MCDVPLSSTRQHGDHVTAFKVCFCAESVNIKQALRLLVLSAPQDTSVTTKTDVPLQPNSPLDTCVLHNQLSTDPIQN